MPEVPFGAGLPEVPFVVWGVPIRGAEPTAVAADEPAVGADAEPATGADGEPANGADVGAVNVWVNVWAPPRPE